MISIKKFGCLTFLLSCGLLVLQQASADTLTLNVPSVPVGSAWIDGNQWQDLGQGSVASRTLTLSAAALPPSARVTKVTVNVTFSKNDGPNCYTPAVAQDPGVPYALSSGLWNSGACPLEPTATYPDNTTMGRSFPNEIYLALTAPNNVSTVLLPVNQYIRAGNANYDNIALSFQDTGASAIPLGSHPVSGTFKPVTPLAVYNGTPVQGNWTLTFGDNFSEDPLHILNWGVVIEYSVAPTVRIRKTTTGGTGTFSFTQTNLRANPAPITTTSAGVAVAGPPVEVTAVDTAVTVLETATAGYALLNATAACSDANSAKTGQTARFGSIANGVLTIPAINVKDSAVIECDFTNARQVDLQITKSANPSTLRAGALVSYRLDAINNGPGFVSNAVLRDVPGSGLDCRAPGLPVATCTTIGFATCPTMGALTVSQLTSDGGLGVPFFGVGGGVRITFQCKVTASGTLP